VPGTALAPPLLTLLMLSFNWRWMFVAMDVVGLIAAGIWTLPYRDRYNVRREDRLPLVRSKTIQSRV
jgi:predicted MFS family arabinose efflux permease